MAETEKATAFNDPITMAEWKGLDYRVPSTMKNQAYLSDMINARIINGEIEGRYGHSLLSTLPAGVVSLHCFQMFDGVWFLMAFTTTKVYKWDTINLEWDDISGSVSFTGESYHTFGGAMYNNVYYFCNIADPVYVWTGDGNIALSSDSYRSRIMIPFGERLCRYNMVESGNNIYQRVRYPAAGSATDFTSAGSGFYDLTTQLGSDSIIAAEILGGNVAIYGNEHIVTQQYVGGDTIFSFDSNVIAKGAVSQNAIVAFPHMHIVVARDNIYANTGGTYLEPIGDPIQKWLYSKLDPEHWGKSFAEYREGTNEFVYFFPDTSNAGINYNYVAMNLITGLWSKGTCPGYTCGVRFRTTSALTIGDLLATIGDLSWRIGDSICGIAFPFSAYGKSDGKVLKDNAAATQDDGVDFTRSFDTVDITVDGSPDSYVHLFSILTEYLGGVITIKYSLDEGETYTALGSLAYVSAYENGFTDVDLSSKKVRLQFSSTSPIWVRRIILQTLKGTAIL